MLAKSHLHGSMQTVKIYDEKRQEFCIYQLLFECKRKVFKIFVAKLFERNVREYSGIKELLVRSSCADENIMKKITTAKRTSKPQRNRILHVNLSGIITGSLIRFISFTLQCVERLLQLYTHIWTYRELFYSLWQQAL